jgi:1,4-dihydroxy-6-naphthoate synthase
MPNDSRPTLRLGHSPDPDDAFMWWPLFELNGRPARIDTGKFRFAPITADIESLNHRAASPSSSDATHLTPDACLEITAISCAQYPWVQDRYVLTACGASVGDAYGPKLVSRNAISLDELRNPQNVVAIPGLRTSAFGALSILLGPRSFRYEVVPFELIIERVRIGEFAAGLVIHEGQLTFELHGLHLIADLGSWWVERFKLPLPLGVNVIRRDLEQKYGTGTLQEVTATLLRSVRYALAHREEGLAFAGKFGRGIDAGTVDRFVSMYVNRWTLDFGPVGRSAVEVFLSELNKADLAPEPRAIELIVPREAAEIVQSGPSIV